MSKSFVRLFCHVKLCFNSSVFCKRSSVWFYFKIGLRAPIYEKSIKVVATLQTWTEKQNGDNAKGSVFSCVSTKFIEKCSHVESVYVRRKEKPREKKPNATWLAYNMYVPAHEILSNFMWHCVHLLYLYLSIFQSNCIIVDFIQNSMLWESKREAFKFHQVISIIFSSVFA